MLSKMAQPNSVGAGSGGPSGATGRRVPMSLSGGGAGAGGGTVSRLQQAAASNGRSNSPQNSNANKKNSESNVASGPFVAIKKSSLNQQRSSSASSGSSVSSSASKDADKKSHSSKATNGNQKTAQNGNSNAVVKEQQKPKEKPVEKEQQKQQPKEKPLDSKEPAQVESVVEVKPTELPAAEAKKAADVVPSDVIVLDEEPVVVVAPVSTTPTSERKSSRRIASSQQKSPIKPQTIAESPVQKKQPEEVVEEVKPVAVEDVEMEPLAVDASPIRSVAAPTQPTATSTPGRNLFGFRSSSKQATEVELAAQPSNSPVTAPARSFSQISGRRSIRPAETLTPGRLGNYRCVTSDLDTSNCTNTSMNATVGSEIPNSSSFSFSFFGRGRKRERTPPPLSGSQSATDIAQDVEMSPPKRARFDLFSMNLASPFTLLRSRFSKTTISSPSTRQRHEQTPPAGEDEEGSEVQNVSGIINQEEEEQQLNKSAASQEVTVGEDASLETPKKGETSEKDEKAQEEEGKPEEQGEDAVANLAASNTEVPVEGEGANRSRCAIM